MNQAKPRVNNKCSCGSGLKYKLCCRPVNLPIRRELMTRLLERENEALREVLVAANQRFIDAKLPTMEEWISEQDPKREPSYPKKEEK